MSCAAGLRLVFLLALAAAVSSAAERWLKLASPHFLMYTTNGDNKARDALRIFEQARGFFAANSPSRPMADDPVEIIAFSSEKEFAPYRVNKNSIAYYQRGHKCDYIVLQQLGRTYFPAAIHEYTHLFIEHLDLHLPLWLNEGLADVYSSLQPKGDKLMVGSPPPGRLNALMALGPLDVRILLNVNRESAYYNNAQAMAQFYAQSWELAHMLLLGKEYRRRFPEFLTELSESKSAAQAFADVYQKTLDQVNSDLRGYLSLGNITVNLFDIHLDEKQLQPEVTAPAPFEVDLALANLLATHPETVEQARARLSQLAAYAPHNPELEESLAYVAWQEHNLSEASRHFDQALKHGAKSPRMLFNYAGLLHAMGAPPAQMIDILQQVIQLQPDFFDARYDLVMEAVRANDCSAAIAAANGLKTVTPDHAFPLLSTQAYCYLRLNNAPEARRLAQVAKQYAQTPAETQRMDDLLEQTNRVSPPH